ncbi:MAG: molybdopterin converting factor subunit 1 [Gemmataceae bacterium]
MNVRVRLFARARDLAGVDALAIELPAAATVAELRAALAETNPALCQLLPRCAVAVNEDFADDAMNIPRNADVALIPPVSGG